MQADKSLNHDIADYGAYSPRCDAVKRAEVADQLPFFLRAWWLRDRIETEGLGFGEGGAATTPLWLLHSDPICDAANIDCFV